MAVSDFLSTGERSARMALVRSKNTAPELIVRRLAHGLGYRFRLHRRDLPGSPDLVFAGRQAAVFVHGCFWHQHDCRRGKREPKTNAAYWRSKLERIVGRDAEVRERLEELGWKVLIVWECELRDREKVADALVSFLARPKLA